MAVEYAPERCVSAGVSQKLCVSAVVSQKLCVSAGVSPEFRNYARSQSSLRNYARSRTADRRYAAMKCSKNERRTAIAERRRFLYMYTGTASTDKCACILGITQM